MKKRKWRRGKSNPGVTRALAASTAIVPLVMTMPLDSVQAVAVNPLISSTALQQKIDQELDAHLEGSLEVGTSLVIDLEEIFEDAEDRIFSVINYNPMVAEMKLDRNKLWISGKRTGSTSVDFIAQLEGGQHGSVSTYRERFRLVVEPTSNLNDADGQGIAIDDIVRYLKDADRQLHREDVHHLLHNMPASAPVANRAPMASELNLEFVLGKKETITIDLNDFFFDPDGDELFYTAEAVNEEMYSYSVVDASISEGSSLLSVSLNKEDILPGKVYVTARDREDSEDWVEKVLNFHIYNVKPIVPEEIVKVINEDSTLTGQIEAEDPDEDKLFFYIENEPLHGDLVLGEDGYYEYTPYEDYTGEDSFTIEVNDTWDSVYVTVKVTVNNVNDPPEPGIAIANQSTDSLQLFTFAIPQDAFTDPDGDTLTYTAVLVGQGGASDPLPEWLMFDGLTFSGTPSMADVGTYTIRVVATDGSGASASTTFDLTVNKAMLPVASHFEQMSFTLYQGQYLGVKLDEIFYDDDGDPYEIVYETIGQSGDYVANYDDESKSLLLYFTSEYPAQFTHTFTAVSGEDEASVTISASYLPVSGTRVFIKDSFSAADKFSELFASYELDQGSYTDYQITLNETFEWLSEDENNPGVWIVDGADIGETGFLEVIASYGEVFQILNEVEFVVGTQVSIVPSAVDRVWYVGAEGYGQDYADGYADGYIHLKPYDEFKYGVVFKHDGIFDDPDGLIDYYMIDEFPDYPEDFTIVAYDADSDDYIYIDENSSWMFTTDAIYLHLHMALLQPVTVKAYNNTLGEVSRYTIHLDFDSRPMQSGDGNIMLMPSGDNSFMQTIDLSDWIVDEEPSSLWYMLTPYDATTEITITPGTILEQLVQNPVITISANAPGTADYELYVRDVHGNEKYHTISFLLPEHKVVLEPGEMMNITLNDYLPEGAEQVSFTFSDNFDWYNLSGIYWPEITQSNELYLEAYLENEWLSHSAILIDYTYLLDGDLYVGELVIGVSVAANLSPRLIDKYQSGYGDYVIPDVYLAQGGKVTLPLDELFIDPEGNAIVIDISAPYTLNGENYYEFTPEDSPVLVNRIGNQLEIEAVRNGHAHIAIVPKDSYGAENYFYLYVEVIEPIEPLVVALEPGQLHELNMADYFGETFMDDMLTYEIVNEGNYEHVFDASVDYSSIWLQAGQTEGVADLEVVGVNDVGIQVTYTITIKVIEDRTLDPSQFLVLPAFSEIEIHDLREGDEVKLTIGQVEQTVVAMPSGVGYVGIASGLEGIIQDYGMFTAQLKRAVDDSFGEPIVIGYVVPPSVTLESERIIATVTHDLLVEWSVYKVVDGEEIGIELDSELINYDKEANTAEFNLSLEGPGIYGIKQKVEVAPGVYAESRLSQQVEIEDLSS